MALRRARHGEGPARFEKLSLMIQPLHLGRIGEATALLVDNQRTVFPGIPVAKHDFHEFVGTVVAQIMLEMFVPAHVERFAVVHGGDDIPGGAAACHQIERGEAAGDIERLEIGRRAGRGEAELFGRPSPSRSARRWGPSSRSECHIRRYGRGRCRNGPASPACRRRRPCGTCRPPECGRSPDSSRLTSNRRAIPDAATSSAHSCNSAPAGSRSAPFAGSCCPRSLASVCRVVHLLCFHCESFAALESDTHELLLHQDFKTGNFGYSSNGQFDAVHDVANNDGRRRRRPPSPILRGSRSVSRSTCSWD